MNVLIHFHDRLLTPKTLLKCIKYTYLHLFAHVRIIIMCDCICLADVNIQRIYGYSKYPQHVCQRNFVNGLKAPAYIICFDQQITVNIFFSKVPLGKVYNYWKLLVSRRS